MDTFALGNLCKVLEMSDFGCNGPSKGQSRQSDAVNKQLAENEDLLMEQILDNLNYTPIGQVLKTIASLPEVRREKVLDVRRQLTEGKYELNKRLDVTLDKVLEDLIT